MDRMTVKERREAVSVVLAEWNVTDTGGGASPQERAGDWLHAVEGAAVALHRLYVKACNEPMSEAETERANRLERELRQRFAQVGLGLYLNGDPRGNPVGILTPKTGRYNTMGGAECGWRL